MHQPDRPVGEAIRTDGEGTSLALDGLLRRVEDGRSNEERRGIALGGDVPTGRKRCVVVDADETANAA